MKTYYEKRSVEKDGMPKEDGHYIVIISDDEGMWLATTDMPFRGGKFYFRGGKFYGLDPKSVSHYLVPVSERAVEERATLWGCYMEGTDEKGISDDILLSVHSTAAGAHENSMRMQKEYGGKHYTDKVVIHA